MSLYGDKKNRCVGEGKGGGTEEVPDFPSRRMMQ